MTAESGFQAQRIVPTAEQLAIQRAAGKSLIVQANAGAAKTTSLALRIGAALAAGVAPERLLALTFTSPACLALAGALKTIGVPHAVARRVPIRTFDHFAAAVLLSVERRPVPVKSSAEEVAPVVWQAVRALDMSADDRMVERFLTAAARLKGTLARDALRWEGIRLSPDSAEDLGVEHGLLRLFDAYERIRYPRVDGQDRPRFRAPFDATYDLARLLADPDSDTPIAEIPGWPHGLSQLLVDEMHDTNLAMFTILQALLRDSAISFCGVGDADQVVHTSHGAEQRFMDRRVELGSGRQAMFLPLTATRRFDKRIARAASLIAAKPYASDSAHASGLTCLAYAEEGPLACEAQVVAQARLWQAQPGARLSDLAVLLRHPHQSVLLENALLAAGMSYTTLGFDRYVLQPEVLLVRALLAVALDNFDALGSETTRRRLVRAVVFFCGVRLSHLDSEDETLAERENSAVEEIAADASALRVFFDHQVLENGHPAMSRRLRAAIAVAREVRGPDMFPRFLAALDMASLVRLVFVEKSRREDAMAYMDGLARAARAFDSAERFFASLNTAETQRAETRAAHKDAINNAALKKRTLLLATVPAVKGLEFEHVMLPYLARGDFPAEGADPVEERNLFYVGMTRARRALTLLASGSHPSPFVTQAGLHAEPPG